MIEVYVYIKRELWKFILNGLMKIYITVFIVALLNFLQVYPHSVGGRIWHWLFIRNLFVSKVSEVQEHGGSILEFFKDSEEGDCGEVSAADEKL